MSERLKTTMRNAGVDHLILASPENVYYSTRFNNPALRRTEVYSVVSSNPNEPTYLVAPAAWIMELSRSDNGSLIHVPYGSHSPLYSAETTSEATELKRLFDAQEPAVDAHSALAALLTDLGCDSKRTAFEAAAFNGYSLERIKGNLHWDELVRGEHVVTKARMVKDASEIEILRRAAEGTLRAVHASARAAYEGMTELELAHIFEAHLLEHNLKPNFSLIGFGGHGAFMGAIPGEQRLKLGDVIRYDVGGTLGFYNSDIGRSFSFGTPSAYVRDIWRTSARAQRTAIEMMRPGADIGEIFAEAMQVVKAGIPLATRKHIGHAIGLSVYDQPLLAPNQTVTLEEGMVFCVETPYYEIGLGGFQPEDMVSITADGVDYLTTPNAAELIVL